MVASLAINPTITSNAAGSFFVQSEGLIVGTAYPDPATRFALSGGILAQTEIKPMWGGVAISEATALAASASNPQLALGGTITRAVTYAPGFAGSITGFAVFDQDYAMINSPQSPVPQQISGGLVNFYRWGSGARIALQLNSAVASSYQGDIINTPISWDYYNEQLTTQATITTATITASSGITVNVDGSVTFVTSVATGLRVGDVLTITGFTGGTAALFNTSFIVAAVTNTGATLQTTPLGVPLGTAIPSGTGTIATGVTAALPLKVLEVDVGNSFVPVYNATTGFLTWNRSGTAAVVLLT